MSLPLIDACTRAPGHVCFLLASVLREEGNHTQLLFRKEIGAYEDRVGDCPYLLAKALRLSRT